MHTTASAPSGSRFPFIFGGYPPYIGCVEYLDRAFDWAETHKIKILIDLHTVPDSQNGFANGGMCGVCNWHKTRARET